MRTRFIVGGKIAVLSLVFLMVVWYRDVLTRESGPLHGHRSPLRGKITTISIVQNEKIRFEAAGILRNEGSVKAVEEEQSPKVLDDRRRDQFVRAIFNPADQTFQRLECPELEGSARYETLKPPADSPPRHVRFFFALDLTQCVDLLPRLLGSIVETVRFLGPENCVLSIVEGNSNDGTPQVLEAIRADIEALGTEYFYQTSNINSRARADAPGQSGDRIVSLARLRNLALQPMLDDLQPMLDDMHRYDANTTVVFLNDVAACMEDILELVYQKALLGADMTCAMDWTYVGPSPTFYDVWISRTITGESFFRIPEDQSWDYAWNLFWNDLETQRRFEAHLPFQVFSCWNGAVAFTAEPVLNSEVAFRGSKSGECYQGEPQLFCKDLWYVGHNKIAVVPSVNLEYSDERGKDIKVSKGYTSRWVGSEADNKSQIDWKPNPPDQVKCMEFLGMAEWRAWNETLPAGPSHQSRQPTHID